MFDAGPVWSSLCATTHFLSGRTKIPTVLSSRFVSTTSERCLTPASQWHTVRFSSKCRAGCFVAVNPGGEMQMFPLQPDTP